MGVKERILLMVLSLILCGTTSSSEVAIIRNEGGGAGEHADCLKSLVELRSCSNEILHYFTNGGVDLISYHCCCAINVIAHNCWPALLISLGITLQQAHYLCGYCDASASSPAFALSPSTLP
ncbi:hypothetical protein PIB30_076232 [Stylosanthes scabra]|uniref:Prolamin-like domain-containing protein n=1 Tax=Stylosanthes scabra TaxID=79078 RepID=A0ABU6XNJ7_9FABA|nr:hypothetical protein [Stylosanthes scabra]